MLALSQRSDGNMKLSSDRGALKNREVFLKKQGLDPQLVVSADLVHGNSVAVVTEKEAAKVIPQTDGLITMTPGLLLSVTVADCLPVFLFDPKQCVVGLVHAGWRSLAQNILPRAIEIFQKDFNSQSENILAGIGPAIGKCHFQVGQEVINSFKDIIAKVPESATPAENGKYFVDLKLIARMQLHQAGLIASNIEASSACTFCEKEKYFSARRDQPKKVQAMLAVIGIKG